MADFTAKDIQKLRVDAGVGMMDAKQALTDAAGDVDKAFELLRERGQASMAKRADREANEGTIGTYIHIQNGRPVMGVMVELACETDFVAKNEEFQDLLKELTLAVCAFSPIAVSKDDIPKEAVEAEKEKYAGDLKGKPPEIAAKIVEGKLEKNLYAQKCLLHMPFPKEEKFKGSYGDFLKSKIAVLKENIVVRRFQRMEVGG